MCKDGRWVRADELKIGVDRALVGLEAPHDEIGDDETGFVLQVGDLSFSMETQRAEALALVRLIGHLLHDGSISELGQGCVSVGQALDREMVLNDVELLTGKRPVANAYDERKWSIVLPADLTANIAKLDGVRVGKRIHQAPSLPAFVTDEKCPLAIVREFLGRRVGRRWTRAIAASLERARRPRGFVASGVFAERNQQTRRGATRSVRANARIVGALRREHRGRDGSRISDAPCSHVVCGGRKWRRAHRSALAIDRRTVVHRARRLSLLHQQNAVRASAAAVYWRTVKNIGAQRLQMASAIETIHAQTPELSFATARAQAQTQLLERETAVFPHYSLLNGHDRFNRLPQQGARQFQPLHRDSCGFPSPVELFEQLGVRDWFAPLQASGENTAKRYATNKESLEVPAFVLNVIDRRDAGYRAVFDLTVDDYHSFVAGGVAVHNCIGNSGPLDPNIEDSDINEFDLVVASVLSGNRNFEARVHQAVKANFLMSPPLVVAFALAGRVDWQPETEPIGTGKDGQDVFLRDIWAERRRNRRRFGRRVRRRFVLA